MQTCSVIPEARAIDGSVRLLGAEAALVDGRYELDTPLGRGSFGMVQRARDVVLDRFVALKWLDSRESAKPSRVARFRLEAAALAAVHSPHVAQVYGFGTHRQSPFIAMELIDGVSLSQHLRELARRGEKRSLERAVELLLALARGLGAVHGAGFVHRDVKPSNVLIEHKTGRVVLVDFGLARAEINHERDSLLAAGTPLYAPPEQLLGEDCNAPELDVYAWGTLAYELLTGQCAHEGDAVELVRSKLLDAPRSAAALDPRLACFDPLFQRALAPHPWLRFHSMLEAAEALEAAFARACLAGLEAPAKGPSKALTVQVLADDPQLRKLAVRALQVALLEQPATVHALPSHALLDGALPPAALLVIAPGAREAETLVALTRLQARAGREPTRVLVLGGSESFAAAYHSVGCMRLPREVDFATLVRRISSLELRGGAPNARLHDEPTQAASLRRQALT